MSVINLANATPLLIYELKMFALARVNQTPTLAFLDTGGHVVAISEKLAQGLPRAGQMTMASAFAQKTFDLVEDLDVEFLGHVRRTRASVYEGANDQPFEAEITLNASLIFEQPLVFDFRLLHLALPHQIAVPSWVEIEATYLEKTNLCLFTLQSDGRDVVAIFDTGAGISAVNSIHVDELGLNLEPAYELEVGDATGAKTTQAVSRCSNLRLKDWLLPPFDCFQYDLQPIENALGHRVDMIFGANAMLKSGWRWLFDRPTGKAYIAE